MIDSLTTQGQNHQSSIILPQIQEKKHLKVSEITYRNNIESDYTEKIEQLDKSFNYADNSNYYWSDPELSTFYGTPLYAEASPAQKIALNHLYWVTQYTETAASEANTILYNDVTNGVFLNIGGYDTLCKELALESQQERHHIHAFHKVSYKTNRALLGKGAFSASIKENPDKSLENYLNKKSSNGIWQKLFSSKGLSSSASSVEDAVFRLLRDIRLKSKSEIYSSYLHELEEKDQFLPGPRTGILRVFPQALLRLFTLSWGSSSFLASQYYCFRYIANMLLKTAEYEYTRYSRELEKKGEHIPTPTEISRYHLLDESFHTTMSKIIAQDMYKDFHKPTAYERFMGNLSIDVTQKRLLGGLSGVMPVIFQDDSYFILAYYRLLRSPLFEMSSKEALHWLKKCLCTEHEGFHVNLKYHQRLLSEFRSFFGQIDYMWASNREMHAMTNGGSIQTAIKKNNQFFEDFSKSFAN